MHFENMNTMSRATEAESLTILCIDDHVNDLEFARCYLEESGYNVLTATSGEQAIEIARRNSIAGVLLDYRMPGKDGEHVALDIWRAHPEVPIILLSAFTEYIPQRLLAAVDACIDKRVAPEKWVSEVQRICGRTAN